VAYANSTSVFSAANAYASVVCLDTIVTLAAAAAITLVISFTGALTGTPTFPANANQYPVLWGYRIA
jgi:hypothetical protein